MKSTGGAMVLKHFDKGDRIPKSFQGCNENQGFWGCGGMRRSPQFVQLLK